MELSKNFGYEGDAQWSASAASVVCRSRRSDEILSKGMDVAGEQEFKKLKSDIIELLSSQGVHELADDASGPSINDMDVLALSIDGVGVMLSHCAPVQGDRAFVFCEFGAMPPELELEAARRLMELNFLLYRGNSPTFARDPQSGRIMLMAEIPLSEATAENTFGYMRSTAAQALEWRRTFFLDAGASTAPEFSALA